MGGAAVPIPQGGLEVVSIAKSYDKRAVLTDISLSVGKGEVLGLLGPNGAGKTTCFYSIMGLVRPDSGRILLDGVDITRCRCIAARCWGWAICRRKPRSFAA
jgi:lipopolysaccharide export system ATP-binding protein